MSNELNLLLAVAPSALPPPALTPWGMYLAADNVVKAVMLLLVLASLATWTVLAAKALQFRQETQRLRLARQALLEAGALADVGAGAVVQAGLPQALLRAAAQELQLSTGLADHAGLNARVAARLQRIELEHAAQLRRGTGVLASIGALAPFVGLFGTVWGIMNSFVGIAQSNTTNLAVVAPGIAEALLATAMGLVAAIPAVLVYNHFTRVLAGLRRLSGDLGTAIQLLVSRDLDRMGGQ